MALRGETFKAMLTGYIHEKPATMHMKTRDMAL